jgi:tetratricopeptide (TPR) repeat protein
MMLATPIYWPNDHPQNRNNLRKLACLLVALLFFASSSICMSAEPDPATVARRQYWTAQAWHAKQPTNSTLAWEFARACYDVAEYATNNGERSEIAQQGITTCVQLLARQPDSAPGHYYFGMNLGQLARTKGLAALKTAQEMKQEFAIARDLDEQFDYAGPDRNLGMFYRDAPAWIGLGSRTRAIEHLKHATELAPEYPENRLALVEAYLKWNDRNGARRELKGLEQIWTNAHATLAGQTWASSWPDWDNRFKNLKKTIEGPSKALETPHEQ